MLFLLTIIKKVFCTGAADENLRYLMVSRIDRDDEKDLFAEVVLSKESSYDYLGTYSMDEKDFQTKSEAVYTTAMTTEDLDKHYEQKSALRITPDEDRSTLRGTIEGQPDLTKLADENLGSYMIYSRKNGEEYTFVALRCLLTNGKEEDNICHYINISGVKQVHKKK